MAIKKQYKLGNEGREAIKNVAKQVGDILGKTLGPAGRNYFLPTGITNDGRTIVSEIRFENECEDNVALAFHEMARQTDKDAGDGTTTTMVIGAQLAQDALDKIPDIDAPIGGNQSAMDIMRNLETDKNKVLELLKSKVIKVESLEDLKKVAKTAMETEGSDIIAEAMWQAGKDTYPVLDNGFNGKIETDIVKGISFPLSIATQAMFNGIGKAEYHDVPVLVANHCFEQYLELAPFMMSMLQTKTKQNALIIVGKQFSVPFINAVSDAVKRAGFPILLVSGNFHNDTFGDIASFCDAKLIDTHPKGGIKITEAKFQDAGYAKTVIARGKETTFIGGRGLESLIYEKEIVLTRVGARVEEIKKLKEKEKDGKERDLMDKRIAALLGGIATIYVDAKTAAERYYLKLKVEDAMNSCKGALNDGMLKGGGITLKEIAEELGESSLLYNALKKPYERIIQNNIGKEFDLEGVFDSYAVVKAGVENAVSVCKVICSLEGIIADKEKDLVDDLQNKLNKI